MGVPAAQLVKYELLRDLGGSMKDYSKAVSEIKAAN
jgi:spermidine/putrescine transport system substrate-binding protein